MTVLGLLMNVTKLLFDQLYSAHVSKIQEMDGIFEPGRVQLILGTGLQYY